jgi:hypothetical protein
MTSEPIPPTKNHKEESNMQEEPIIGPPKDKESRIFTRFLIFGLILVLVGVILWLIF